MQKMLFTKAGDLAKNGTKKTDFEGVSEVYLKLPDFRVDAAVLKALVNPQLDQLLDIEGSSSSSSSSGGSSSDSETSSDPQSSSG